MQWKPGELYRVEVAVRENPRLPNEAQLRYIHRIAVLSGLVPGTSEDIALARAGTWESAKAVLEAQASGHAVVELAQPGGAR